MGQISVENDCGGIKGLKVITPSVHGDDRGYFMETYQKKDFVEAGIDCEFVQDNQSSSKREYSAVFISRFSTPSPSLSAL